MVDDIVEGSRGYGICGVCDVCDEEVGVSMDGLWYNGRKYCVNDMHAQEARGRMCSIFQNTLSLMYQDESASIDWGQRVLARPQYNGRCSRRMGLDKRDHPYLLNVSSVYLKQSLNLCEEL